MRWFPALLGLFMALVLSKLGNPIIFNDISQPPSNFWEFVLTVWPPTWGFFPLVPIVIFALVNARFQTLSPSWIAWLPLAWLLWALFSCANSVAPPLSRLTIQHFAASIFLFYVGLFALGRIQPADAFWRIMIASFLFILWMGWDQHYGGLEATRKMFLESGSAQNLSPEYRLRLESNRIFSTFVYPNAYAGALILWGPVLTVALWQWLVRAPSLVQKVAVGLLAYTTAASLVWTGSKAGWLIALAMAAVALLHLKMSKSLKLGVIAAVIVLGLAAFAVKYRGYFQNGATSASARVIYWTAALQIAGEHPVLGAGPGTFAKTFSPIKPPEAEMARLTHNDYLEQACDSGWPAFILYLSFISAALVLSHRAVHQSPLHFAAWLGVLGWSLQSFVEFGLYIPAIAWSAFLLLGWLLSSRIAIDTPPASK